MTWWHWLLTLNDNGKIKAAAKLIITMIVTITISNILAKVMTTMIPWNPFSFKRCAHLEIYSFDGVTVRFGLVADQFRFPNGFERTLRALEIFDVDTAVLLHQIIRMNEIWLRSGRSHASGRSATSVFRIRFRRWLDFTERHLQSWRLGAFVFFVGRFEFHDVIRIGDGVFIRFSLQP